MSCQRTEEMKLVANLKDKYIEMKQSQPLTMHINHTARSCKLEGYAFKLNFIVT